MGWETLSPKVDWALRVYDLRTHCLGSRSRIAAVSVFAMKHAEDSPSFKACFNLLHDHELRHSSNSAHPPTPIINIYPNMKWYYDGSISVGGVGGCIRGGD